MGLFSRKSNSVKPETGVGALPFPPGDERYPGSAGYSGVGLKKNAMPEHRFTFVRPDGKSEP
jgi:hypothetical protein